MQEPFLPDDLDSILDEDSESSDFMTPTEIYDRLSIDEELLITIEVADAEHFKQRISGAKAKRNEAAKAQGLPTDNRVLSFSPPRLSIDDPNTCTIHVSLKAKTGLKILKMERPSDSIEIDE